MDGWTQERPTLWHREVEIPVGRIVAEAEEHSIFGFTAHVELFYNDPRFANLRGDSIHRRLCYTLTEARELCDRWTAEIAEHYRTRLESLAVHGQEAVSGVAP